MGGFIELLLLSRNVGAGQSHYAKVIKATQINHVRFLVQASAHTVVGKPSEIYTHTRAA